MIQIYNDDCLSIIKQLPDNSIDLIATDPPYDIPSIDGSGSINNIKKLNKSLNDLKTIDITNGYDIEMFGKEFVRVLKDKLRGDNFWSPSYFLATTGNVTLDVLMNYVQNQRALQES